MKTAILGENKTMELQAKDLRIGNFISLGPYIYDNWYEVDGVVLAEFEKEGCDPYKPIPLTSEWLERFGFDQDHHKVFPPYHTVTVREFWTASQGIFKGEYVLTYVEDLPFTLPIRFKYVHQIQNLFHSLTGEELTLQSEKK